MVKLPDFNKAFEYENKFVIPQRSHKIKKCTIYLGDLAHNFISKGPFVFPINIGYVAAYAKKYYPDAEIKLFKFPIDLINAIKEKKPDIVGLSNYTWNLELNNKMTEFVKTIDQNIITVLGGPDFPLRNEQQLKYLKERPFLDFYVVNQGEIGFLNILKKFIETNSIKEMKNNKIGNCAFLTDKLIIGEDRSVKNLDDIPSPYLTRLLDKFFDTNLIPIIETSRGCPYRCTYCAWGNASKDKIFKFSMERIKSEIKYIVERVKNTTLLQIADSNFGIFERDIKTVKLLKEYSNKVNYPRLLVVPWAKNCPKRVIKMAEVLGNIVNVTLSFQSLNPAVLVDIKRNNIPIEQFKQIQDHLNSKHIKSVSELILGLPGETKQSHEDALRKLFDYNTSNITCYNLRLLGGTLLNNPEQKQQFNLKTKFRLVDGSFGKYDKIIAVESEEMVLATSTMSQEDILYFRPIHWLIQFLWNKKYYEELLQFLKQKQINPLDIIKRILEFKDDAPEKVRTIINNFYKDAKEEWFDSHEELRKCYLEKFDFIAKGGFGKLNFKYTYKILLEVRKDFDSYLFEVSSMLLAKEIGALENIMKFLSSSCIDFKDGFKEHISEFDYDILRWKNDSYKKPIEEYKRKVNYRFYLDPKQEASLNKSLKQFGQNDLNLTLRKMTEYININDLFYKVEEVN